MKKLICFSVALVFSGLLMSCEDYTGKFILLNNSSELIANISVKVCNQRFEFHDIKVGSSVVATYKIKADDHFNVNLEFSNGKKLNGNVGYITNGFDFSHEIIVSDRGIDIRVVD